jgi:hypothetical protein
MLSLTWKRYPMLNGKKNVNKIFYCSFIAYTLRALLARRRNIAANNTLANVNNAGALG